MPTPPSTGAVTSPYGPRTLNVPGVGPFHYGADRGGQGNVAPEAGEIVFAVYSGVFGNIIGVRSGDVVWNIAHHAHLNDRRPGQRVAEGEFLAPLGQTGLATGPHSHTERRVGGRDAIQSGAHTDPEQYYTAPAPAGGGATPLLTGSTPPPAESEEDDMTTQIRIINGPHAGTSFTLEPFRGIKAHANVMGARLGLRARNKSWPPEGDQFEAFRKNEANGELQCTHEHAYWLADILGLAELLPFPAPGGMKRL